MRICAVMPVVALLAVSTAAIPVCADYDPLQTGRQSPERRDTSVEDERRSRAIPVRVYLPAMKSPAAVILFSHGLGGNREGYAYLGEHWSRRGYLCVFLQHPGSDDSVWKDKPVGERMAAMRGAAGIENFRLRVADVPAVLNQLEKWNRDESHFLCARMNLDQIGMAGHSFGAVTTQAVSGQSFPLRKNFTDGRIRAAVAMSPSSPRRGGVDRAFGSVSIPWMLLTGTNDTAPIGDADVASRLAVFPALPEGEKYELVLNLAEHSAFSDRALPGDGEKRNPNHHRAILAVTTAFWDAHLRRDQEARDWIDGKSVREILEPGDTWRTR